MQKDISLKLSIGVGLFVAVICAITAIYSYQAYDSARDIQKAHQQSLDTLHHNVARLEATLTEISHKLAPAQDQTDRTAVDLNLKKLKPRGSQPSASQLQTLQQMEQILDSTGLAQLAENENVDPHILQQMYDEYAQRNQIASYRQQLLQKDGERLGNDKFATVTTDRGMEVMPNIEHYLAQQYLRDGRIEDARVLRDSLELNFSDSYILTKEPGSGRKWVPVLQVVSKLDQQIK